MKVHHAIRHSFDFLLLAAIIALALGGILYFRFDVASQIAITVLLVVFYVFWGVFHHAHDGDLTANIIFEYLAMSALVGFILMTFLLRV